MWCSHRFNIHTYTCVYIKSIFCSNKAAGYSTCSDQNLSTQGFQYFACRAVDSENHWSCFPSSYHRSYQKLYLHWWREWLPKSLTSQGKKHSAPTINNYSFLGCYVMIVWSNLECRDPRLVGNLRVVLNLCAYTIFVDARLNLPPIYF